MKKLFLIFFFGGMLCLQLSAQAPGSLEYQEDVFVARVVDEIILDGNLDEKSWSKSLPAKDFWQNFPADTMQAADQTEIYMVYDDEFLYVGVKAFTRTEEYITPSLRRDYRFSGHDNVSLMFDTFNDQTNAFLFGMNAFGVRREALIANGGRQRQDFSGSWDNKWYGEVGQHDGYWVAEFAIPFKTVRFQEGGKQWRFNCYRFDTHQNEISSWTRIPRNQIVMNLGYMSRMVWEEPLKKPGKNISIIPYLTGGTTRDFTDPTEEGFNPTAGIGGDAKIGITSGLNLDLTVNPDFSQVEVDQQVTNLDRFEIFFPERRQFFLENADLFGSFGLTRVNPFFSRRIGVARDTTTGQNIQNPILFGARLTGKLNDRLRVGLINMQTAAEPENGLPSFNYTMAAVQQQVFKRSNLAFIFVNKDAVNGKDFGGEYDPFNRVAGVEYRLGTPDNSYSGKVFYHRAFTVSDDRDKYSHGFQVEHQKRRYRMEWAHLIVGNGFDAQVGFVPRRDYMLFSPEGELYFYNPGGLVSQHTVGFDYRMIYDLGQDGNTYLPSWGLADRELEVNWEMAFKDNSRGTVTLNNAYTFLLDDFDPTRIHEDSLFLPAGTAYTYSNVELQYRSNSAKRFFFDATPTIGQFFSGWRTGISGSFTYRYQPFGFISLAYDYNRLSLGGEFPDANLWLVGPRIDLTFSRKVFFTTFIQYNNQLDNLNINARLQWRFKPVSDFFLVFTDNYLTDPFSQFSVRNRAIVAKLTYWLNM